MWVKSERVGYNDHLLIYLHMPYSQQTLLCQLRIGLAISNMLIHIFCMAFLNWQKKLSLVLKIEKRTEVYNN